MYTYCEFMPPQTTRSPFSAWTDEEILLEYRLTYQRSAFEELIHRYQRELYSYLRRYLGDVTQAEDVFQNTFLQVHLKCDQFDETRSFRAWLYRIATNQAIDVKRFDNRRAAVSLNVPSDEDTNAGDDLALSVPSSISTPSEIAVENEEAKHVREAIEKLPESLQQPLYLVYFQGMKYQEAADTLGIPNGTVKSRIHTAMEKLGFLLKN